MLLKSFYQLTTLHQLSQPLTPCQQWLLPSHHITNFLVETQRHCLQPYWHPTTNILTYLQSIQANPNSLSTPSHHHLSRKYGEMIFLLTLFWAPNIQFIIVKYCDALSGDALTTWNKIIINLPTVLSKYYFFFRF